MRRIFLQVYLTVVGCVVLFALSSALLWATIGPDPERRRTFEGFAQMAQQLLPPAGADRASVEAALEGPAEAFDVDLALFAADGSLLGSAALHPLPRPPARPSGRIALRSGRHGPGVAVPLRDGRVLVLRHRTAPHRGLLWVALFAAVTAAGAYPVVRRLTGRLERLRRRVDALGSGDLGSRVAVEGRDEVAELALAFNRAADRIEELVGAQRRALASASHDLRTPLARIQMAIELLDAVAEPRLTERMRRDVAELDDLIDEILTASRLDSGLEAVRFEPVELLALVAEEVAAWDLEAGGEEVTVPGEPKLLRRLVRNLLANARRHGAGADVEVEVTSHGDGALITVADRGPGIPEAEQARIFEPFYRPPGESGTGSGLGLALVRQIATLHGGRASCRSREGGGMRFEVWLGRPETGVGGRESGVPSPRPRGEG